MAAKEILPRAHYRRRFYVTEQGDLRCEVPGEYAVSVSGVLAPNAEELQRMLREMRTRTGFSRAYLAALLGASKETFRGWESGKRNPSGAAKRLIWLMWCGLFEPDRIQDTEQIITWGRFTESCS